jgi:bifunctional enzyme CysN/CysC
MTEQMNIVIVGHVDHGKSTVIGRLLADTASLPEGKLEQVKEFCKSNSRPFEYAFLLDALKDEQSQGITIDSARCFFKSKKRDYIIIDAPGHIEFLKNMVSGAARAEAALLVIDANEGIQENSKRHGYLLSMLGIKQIIILVNKMDIVNYDQKRFNQIVTDYTKFLKEINITPKTFIPVSGLKGDNIAKSSDNIIWSNNETVLTALDSFKKEEKSENKPFRMPVQDIYKFTKEGDDRRIITGRIESGEIKVGDKIVFLPSNKGSTVRSIEEFNTKKRTSAKAKECIGLTLKDQIYIKRGDIARLEKANDLHVSSLLKCNLFWMGKKPMIKNKEYKLKINTESVPVKIKEIENVLDTSKLSKNNNTKINRHEVAKCTLECSRQIAYDLASNFETTSRFVIVDDFDISGGGIITEFVDDGRKELRKQILSRELKWDHSDVSQSERTLMYGQCPKTILITGKTNLDKKSIAKAIEKRLFELGRKAYFLGIGNILRGLNSDIGKDNRDEHIRRLAEVDYIMMDAGLIVIATASDLTKKELNKIKTILGDKSIIIINLGKNDFEERLIDLNLNEKDSIENNAEKVLDLLKFKNIIYNV